MTAKFPKKENRGNMNSLMNGNQSLTHCCRRCQNKAKMSRPRHLHQSTLNLGETAPCYITTHNQSYSGRSADGHPLIFHLRDTSFPSQQQTHLDISNNITPLQCPLLSHTQEVYRPKQITLRANMNMENWIRYHSGQAVREITNPQDISDYWTMYKTEYRSPVTNVLPQLAGKPTQWHQHNILTGEQRQTPGPGKSSRKSSDKVLWAARRWETECSALRLY